MRMVTSKRGAAVEVPLPLGSRCDASRLCPLGFSSGGQGLADADCLAGEADHVTLLYGASDFATTPSPHSGSSSAVVR